MSCKYCGSYFHYGPGVCCLSNPIHDEGFCCITCYNLYDEHDVCPVCEKPYNGYDRPKAIFTDREIMCYSCYCQQPKIIAVDFDATLADYSGWKGHDHRGDPLPGAREFLEELKKMGFEIYIYTSRLTDGIQDWLNEYELAHLITGITNKKIAAYCYVDDRAINFNNNYNETLKEIKQFNPWYRRRN